MSTQTPYTYGRHGLTPLPPHPYYDVSLARHELEMLTDAGVLDCLRDMFPVLDLYAVSTDWRDVPDIRTIKAKGAGGDVLAQIVTAPRP
jgi:hypothetical protein